MEVLDSLLFVLAYALIAMTFITILPLDHWLVRIFDFPKVQLLTLSAASFLFCLFYLDWSVLSNCLLLGFLFVAIVFHAYRILPFTFLYPKEVLRCQNVQENQTLSLLASNVLTSNTNYDALIQLIEENQPDLVLTLESDEHWEKALTKIEKEYTYSAKVPQNNFYGMHFYSKLVIKNLEVCYLFKDGIPSIKCQVQLPNKQWIHIFSLHPKPPSPTEAPTSTNRDAELLKVGKEVSEIEKPTVVFGDLNDVAWSKSTTLFRKISGLLDPRIGRGRYCTFHADYKLFRWPLDHLFHSKDFCLVDLKVLPSIGSDHFPIFAKLQLSNQAGEKQEAPKADSEEKERAAEKIEKAEF